jgi:streptothricin acetyltransferase
MPTLTIVPLDSDRIGDVYRCDGSFWIDSRLRLDCPAGHPQFEVIPVEPRIKKRYPLEDRDLSLYIHEPDRVIFLAYLDGKIAGQIILRKNWNAFGYIEDISVDSAYRRQGIGQRLLEKAAGWARDRGLPGLMLETQDINVAACRLYSAFGFRLEGFDRNLYKGLDPHCDEIALYWYLTF